MERADDAPSQRKRSFQPRRWWYRGRRWRRPSRSPTPTSRRRRSSQTRRKTSRTIRSCCRTTSRCHSCSRCRGEQGRASCARACLFERGKGQGRGPRERREACQRAGPRLSLEQPGLTGNEGERREEKDGKEGGDHLKRLGGEGSRVGRDEAGVVKEAVEACREGREERGSAP